MNEWNAFTQFVRICSTLTSSIPGPLAHLIFLIESHHSQCQRLLRYSIRTLPSLIWYAYPDYASTLAEEWKGQRDMPTDGSSTFLQVTKLCCGPCFLYWLFLTILNLHRDILVFLFSQLSYYLQSSLIS